MRRLLLENETVDLAVDEAIEAVAVELHTGQEEVINMLCLAIDAVEGEDRTKSAIKQAGAYELIANLAVSLAKQINA